MLLPTPPAYAPPPPHSELRADACTAKKPPLRRFTPHPHHPHLPTAALPPPHNHTCLSHTASLTSIYPATSTPPQLPHAACGLDVVPRGRLTEGLAHAFGYGACCALLACGHGCYPQSAATGPRCVTWRDGHIYLRGLRTHTPRFQGTSCLLRWIARAQPSAHAATCSTQLRAARSLPVLYRRLPSSAFIRGTRRPRHLLPIPHLSGTLVTFWFMLLDTLLVLVPQFLTTHCILGCSLDLACLPLFRLSSSHTHHLLPSKTLCMDLSLTCFLLLQLSAHFFLDSFIFYLHYLVLYCSIPESCL